MKQVEDYRLKLNEELMLMVNEERAKEQIRTYIDVFPGVDKFKKQQHKLLKSQGFLVTPYGRKRRLPDALSGDEYRSSGALRQGFNFLMQEPSSTMTLEYGRRIWEEVKVRGWAWKYVQPYLTVHDSLKWMTRFSHLLEMDDLISETFEERPLPDFDLPVRIDKEIYKSWWKPLVYHLAPDDHTLCGQETAKIEEEGQETFLPDHDIRVPDKNWCKECWDKVCS